MSTQRHPRQPAGTPAGGQFATTPNVEAAVDLTGTHPMVAPNAADNRSDELRTPDAEAVFDAIWVGKTTGFSEKQITSNRAEHVAMLEGLHDKTIPPRAVIGTGYKKGRARRLSEEWLIRQIAAGDAALATRGRTNSVNQGNVRYHLRDAAGRKETTS